LVTLLAIFSLLLLVALWEFCRPRRQLEFPSTRRRIGNVGFWILSLFIGGFFSAPDSSVRATLESVLGVNFPTWPIADAGLTLLAGLLLLDLAHYVVHRLEHAVPLFWRFHALHHSDPDVDVTTALRHHPIEILLTSAAYWVALLVLDIPAVVALIHALGVFGTAAVQHGNIRLPERVERWLKPVLVTTDLHRVHHSVSLDEANSNYGAVLSIWDRLFGTFSRITRAQHEGIVFGVRELPRRDCLKPSAMFLTPWLISRVRIADAPSENVARRLLSVARTGMHRSQRRANSGG
jgi:sterol desaturase/sphingolipid hydroxylase (fatty acid hydroxylase superfamily)